MITVSEIMTPDPLALHPDASLLDAQAFMSASNIHNLPVVENGKLVGLLSESDLLRASGSSTRNDDTQLAQLEALTPLKEVMTTHVSVVHPNDNLRRAGLFLQQHRYGCLPVVEDGLLKGIITDFDFVSVALNLLEQIEETEPLERS